jgi:hypothetical protein
MSRRPKGPRLWLRPARYDAAGQLTHESAWFILDGARQRSTGFSAGEIAEAEKALAAYLSDKHTGQVTKGTRDPDAILIDDVLTLYVRDKVADHARPDDAAYHRSSSVSPSACLRRASTRVSITRSITIGGLAARYSSALRKTISKPALCATSGASSTKARNSSATTVQAAATAAVAP